MADLPDVTLTYIPYLGGPYDGKSTALSDGVRVVAEGGYYTPMWVNGNRVALWHQTEDA